MEFLKQKFDSLLLTLLLLVMISLLLHMSHDKQDSDLVAWVEQASTTVLGALIGITQASRLSWNKGGSNDKTKDGGNVNPTPGNSVG